MVLCPEGEFQLSSSGLLELMRSVLERGRLFRFRARGFSMFPFVRDRDVITIVSYGDGYPGSGDVAAYSGRDNRLVVHRVLGRRGTGYVCQGDNSSGKMEIVSDSDILGRVICVERDGRAIRFGLGSERRLLALLSRRRLLTLLTRMMIVIIVLRRKLRNR